VLIGLFLPSFLVPLIGISILHYALNLIGSRYVQSWNSFRPAADILYFALAGGYPLHKILTFVASAGSLVLRASNLRSKPVVRLPRIGPAPARPARPRARAF
jgi:hypothetical protein